MSNASTTVPDTSHVVTGPPERQVNLVIVYGQKASFTPVKLTVTIETATKIIEHRRKSFASIALFSGVDLHGNPFSVDVGTAAAAVYIEG